jgi:hypothetical protein
MIFFKKNLNMVSKIFKFFFKNIKKSVGVRKKKIFNKRLFKFFKLHTKKINFFSDRLKINFKTFFRMHRFFIFFYIYKKYYFNFLFRTKFFLFFNYKFFSFFLFLKNKNFLLKTKKKKKNIKTVLKEYKIIFFMKQCVIHFFESNFFIVFFKSLFKYYYYFFNFFKQKFEILWGSFILNNFFKKFISNGKTYLISAIFFTVLRPFKFFFNLKPFSVVLASFFSLKTVLGFIPKILAGRRLSVPTYVFFDRQFKNIIKIFIYSLRRKENFLITSSSSTVSFKFKKVLKFTTVFLKTQSYFINVFLRKKYFMDLNKNYLFNFFKKTQYIHILNRTNIQYR